MCNDINAVGLPAAHGGLGAAVSIRAAFYIDGFNLYHAIDDLGLPHLKWVNLFALARQLVRRDESVVRVVWCTAVNNKNTSKMLRWRECWFPCGTEPVFPPRSEPPLSMVF